MCSKLVFTGTCSGPYASLPLALKLLKPYRTAISGISMVVIQCPHCGGEIELHVDGFGLFDCPHCEEEFSYGDQVNALPLFGRTRVFMSIGMKIGLAIIAIAVITFIGFAIFNDDTGVYSGMWIFIPAGICAIGIPIVVISFFVRGYQLNWEV